MSNSAPSSAALIDNKKLPGDLAMWFFILAELTVFAIFFISFAVTEQLNTEMFRQGKNLLHPVAGLMNTLALITSSGFVALALCAIKQGANKKSVAFLITSQLFAVLYLMVKIWEYQSLFHLNIDLETNTFFTLYFLITAFHFLHVILGMFILSFITIRAYKGAYNFNYSGFEAGASYWHMVDLLWIILFPLIYII
jgi:nitric oxide reductase NorE protein